MSTKLHDLNPLNTKLVIGKKTFYLGLFDLRARVWAHERFKTSEEPNGLFALAKRLESQWHDLPAITETVYELLLDKPSTYNKFIKLIKKSKKHNILILVDLFKALNECFVKSEPALDELEEDSELKKSRAAVS